MMDVPHGSLKVTIVYLEALRDEKEAEIRALEAETKNIERQVDRLETRVVWIGSALRILKELVG